MQTLNKPRVDVKYTLIKEVLLLIRQKPNKRCAHRVQPTADYTEGGGGGRRGAETGASSAIESAQHGAEEEEASDTNPGRVRVADQISNRFPITWSFDNTAWKEGTSRNVAPGNVRHLLTWSVRVE